METYNNNYDLAHKMLFNKDRLAQSMERWVRSFLINKNLCLYYQLRKKIGKKLAFGVANAIEKGILIFGREIVPYFQRKGILTEEQE
jgi:hypothetical protein